MSRRNITITQLENEEFARFDQGHVFVVGELVRLDFTETVDDWSGSPPEGFHLNVGVITSIVRTNSMGHRERPFLVKAQGVLYEWWIGKRELRAISDDDLTKCMEPTGLVLAEIARREALATSAKR